MYPWAKKCFRVPCFHKGGVAKIAVQCDLRMLSEVSVDPLLVVEMTGVPVTGGLPMLMSNAVYYSRRSIYMLNNKRLR